MVTMKVIPVLMIFRPHDVDDDDGYVDDERDVGKAFELKSPDPTIMSPCLLADRRTQIWGRLFSLPHDLQPRPQRVG